MDLRVKDFVTEVTPAAVADITGLFLWVDKTGFSDAKKIELLNVLFSGIVDSNTNNYQAMTPKAFYDSISTETELGINRLATDAEVTAKSASGQLISSNQSLMQARWLLDWFVDANGLAVVHHKPTSAFTTAKATSYNTSWQGSLANGSTQALQPSGYQSVGVFEVVYCQLTVKTALGAYVGTVSLEKPTTGSNSIVLGTTGLQLRLYSSGLFCVSNSSGSTVNDVKVAINVQATLV